MSKTLGFYLTLAFSVVCVVALIWTMGGDTLKAENNKYDQHIESNMNEMLLNTD